MNAKLVHVMADEIPTVRPPAGLVVVLFLYIFEG